MFSTSVLKTSSHPEYLATTSHRRTSVASTPNRDYPSLRLISSVHEEDYSPQESKTVWQTGTPLCYDSRTGSAHKPIPAKPNELGITFIGHSSFLIQLGGKNVVIDPNY